tara:strand:- start:642 stop:1091 length:450 start_codon:yes stop_codon:yes gene_type:complete
MVPKDFRAVLERLGERSLVVTYAKGRSDRLELRPAGLFVAYQSRFNEQSKTPPEHALASPEQMRSWAKSRQLMRDFYFGEAEWIEVDKAGRILIPAEKRRSLNLQDKIEFRGMGDETFQVWHPAEREDLLKTWNDSRDEIQEFLGLINM